MKRSSSLPFGFLLAILFLAGSGVLRAQTDYSARGATSRLSVGVGASIGLSVPTGTLADTIEAAPGFSGLVGLNITYPINRVIGTFLNVGYDTRGVGKKVNKELDARSYRTNYLFVEPGFSWSAFRFSVNIGMPMSGTMPVPGGTTSETMDAPKDALSTIIEPRIGAMLVLMDNKQWWLGLLVDGGYTLPTLYKNADDIPDIEGTHQVTAHIGLTWQFAIAGT